MVEAETYDSFGNNGGSARTRYVYTRRERDSDTGMLYYRARFYDPQLGRFISEDPIGFRGGDVNLYVYVKNQPLGSIDPAGTEILTARQYEIPMLPPLPPHPPPPPFDYYGLLFGDGGILTRSTGEEFLSARERARQPCKPFGERWLQSITDTNQAIPGLGAPLGTSLIPSSGASQITGQPGLLGWAWRGGGPGFGSSALQSGATSIATNASFEGGIGVGHILMRSVVPVAMRTIVAGCGVPVAGCGVPSRFDIQLAGDEGEEKVNSEQNDGQMPGKENRFGLKAVISLLVLVSCWILWFVFHRAWIIALGLSVVASLCAEYLGAKVFTKNSWFDRLSVEHSGFSVLRIAIGVIVVLVVFSLIILGRLVFLKIFH